MTETTTTTTTVRRIIRTPKPKPRLVKRVRKVTIRTTTLKGAKAVVRRKAATATVASVPTRRVQIIDVKPIRELPTTTVSRLTVKERQRLPAPR